MPRIRIDVNEAWLQRLQQVLPAAIDTLEGLSHQIKTSLATRELDRDALLKQIDGQIIDLKRMIESVRIIF